MPGRPYAPGWTGTACSPTHRTRASRSPTSSCRAGERESRSQAHRVGRGETAPGGVRGEEIAHLRFLRTRLAVTAVQTPDQFAQDQIAGRQLVQSSLAVQREALD